MKILAFDFGLKRVGVAFCDTSLNVVLPRGYLVWDKSFFEELEKIIKTEKITQLVVGLPLQKSGTDDGITKSARKFAEELGGKTGLAVELVDERFTTKVAYQNLSEVKNQREQKDSLAACAILETYIRRLGK